jgi:hypothetical protein
MPSSQQFTVESIAVIRLQAAFATAWLVVAKTHRDREGCACFVIISNAGRTATAPLHIDKILGVLSDGAPSNALPDGLNIHSRSITHLWRSVRFRGTRYPVPSPMRFQVQVDEPTPTTHA